jgi:hypothetical protein
MRPQIPAGTAAASTLKRLTTVGVRAAISGPRLARSAKV